MNSETPPPKPPAREQNSSLLRLLKSLFKLSREEQEEFLTTKCGDKKMSAELRRLLNLTERQDSVLDKMKIVDKTKD